MQPDHQKTECQPSMCSAGCGFYSNSGPGGMCSKCSREAAAREGAVKAALHEKLAGTSGPSTLPSVPVAPVQLQQLVPVSPAPAPTVEPAVATPSSSGATTLPAPPTPATASTPPSKPSTTRCLLCNKKVGLTGFSCKCNPDAVFCSAHRYAEAHSCTFDYKAAQARVLAENNPVVMASKLTKF